MTWLLAHNLPKHHFIFTIDEGMECLSTRLYWSLPSSGLTTGSLLKNYNICKCQISSCCQAKLWYSIQNLSSIRPYLILVYPSHRLWLQDVTSPSSTAMLTLWGCKSLSSELSFLSSHCTYTHQWVKTFHRKPYNWTAARHRRTPPSQTSNLSWL